MKTKSDKKANKSKDICSRCGYEFITFPDGTKEIDLAKFITGLSNLKGLLCIDCIEELDNENK